MDGVVRTLIQAWGFLAQLILGLFFWAEIFAIFTGRLPSVGDVKTLRALTDPIAVLCVIAAGIIGLLILAVCAEILRLALALVGKGLERCRLPLPAGLGASIPELANLYLRRNQEALLSYFDIYALAFLKQPPGRFSRALTTGIRQHLEKHNITEMLEPSYFIRIVSNDQARSAKLNEETAGMPYLATMAILFPFAMYSIGDGHIRVWIISIGLAMALLIVAETRRRLYASYIAFGYLESFTPGEGEDEAE